MGLKSEKQNGKTACSGWWIRVLSLFIMTCVLSENKNIAKKPWLLLQFTYNKYKSIIFSAVTNVFGTETKTVSWLFSKQFGLNVTPVQCVVILLNIRSGH
jgi:hypothetical protein